MDFEDFERRRNAELDAQIDKFEKQYQSALRGLQEAALRYAEKFGAECRKNEKGVTFKHNGETLTVEVRRVPPGRDTTFDVVENGAIEKSGAFENQMMGAVVRWFNRS